MHALGSSSASRPRTIHEPLNRSPRGGIVLGLSSDSTSPMQNSRFASETYQSSGARSYDEVVADFYGRVAKALNATTVGRSEDLVGAVLAGPVSLARDSQPAPKMGSEEWFEHGKETGVFFALPASLDALVEMSDSGRKDKDRVRACFKTYAEGLAEMNELMSKLIERGATFEQLKILAEQTFGPQSPAGFGGDTGAKLRDFVEHSSQMESVFGLLDTSLRIDPVDTIKSFLDETYDVSEMIVFATGLNTAGVSRLLKNAKELELEVFEDPDGYKNDVNLAVLRLLESSMSDRLTWTEEERRALEVEINRIRNKVIEDRYAAFEEVAPYLPSESYRSLKT